MEEESVRVSSVPGSDIDTGGLEFNVGEIDRHYPDREARQHD